MATEGSGNSCAAQPENSPIQNDPNFRVNSVAFTLKVAHGNLNLQKIASLCNNNEYDKTKKVLVNKFEEPKFTARICHSGSIIGFGAKSLEAAKKGASLLVEILNKTGLDFESCNFQIVNVNASYVMPFKIRVNELADKYPDKTKCCIQKNKSVVFKVQEKRYTYIIHQTGTIIVRASTDEEVKSAASYIVPIVREFQKNLAPQDADPNSLNTLIENLSIDDPLMDMDTLIELFEQLEIEDRE